MPTRSYTKSHKDEARKEVRNALAKINRLVERAKAGDWADYSPTFDDKRANMACADLASALKRLGEWGKKHGDEKRAKKP